MLLLDGREVSRQRLEKLKARVNEVKKSGARAPKLAVLRVGEDPASKIYVEKKIKTCLDTGFLSEEFHFNASLDEKSLLQVIERLNGDDSVDGILLQLPLPSQLSVSTLIEAIDPRKDVDGFHPYNLGRLASMESGVKACTPLGIMRLFEHYKILLEKKRAVVVGRSRIVGRPMSLLLDAAGATVTVVHKLTPQPSLINREADILVVAAGVRHLIGANDIKEAAVVIDVGIHRLENGKLCGDVDFEAVKDKVSAITPVPGGVGPMTICSLLENTFEGYLGRLQI